MEKINTVLDIKISRQS